MTDASRLNPRQEEFARLYYAGPEHLRGNGRRCYMEAYDQDDPECADAAASRLLGRDKVHARIRELREEASRKAKARARSWWELYPDAQDVLACAIRGQWDEMPGSFADDEDKRSAVKAAEEVLERCEGTARQLHEHQVQAGLTVQVAGPDHGTAEPASSSR